MVSDVRASCHRFRLVEEGVRKYSQLERLGFPLVHLRPEPASLFVIRLSVGMYIRRSGVNRILNSMSNSVSNRLTITSKGKTKLRKDAHVVEKSAVTKSSPQEMKYDTALSTLFANSVSTDKLQVLCVFSNIALARPCETH